MTLAADRLARLAAMEGRHFWSVGRDRLTDNLIDRHAMQPPFLDAGAGTGAYAARLAPPRIWFDTGPVEPGGLRATVGAVPGATSSIGTVLLRDVLEHVDDVAALDEAHRLLRPGGHLLVTVPAWPSLWGPRDVAAGHLRRYRRRGLRQVVEGAGFEILDLRGYQFLLLPAVVAARALARLTGDERAAREERIGRLNALFTRINLAEAALARHHGPGPPTGSSLVVVAVRR